TFALYSARPRPFREYVRGRSEAVLSRWRSSPDAKATSASSVTAHEVPNDPVELLRVLHKHEVVPALALLEDLQPGPADLVRDPDLRLPGHETGLAAYNESRNVDPGDDAAPVARGVVVQQPRRVLPGQLQILLDDPRHLVLGVGGGEHRPDEALRRLHSVGSGKGIDVRVERVRVEEGATRLLLFR